MNSTTALGHKVVSNSEWQRACADFLAKEKELTHLSDEVARLRRELPWTKVDKSYVFEGPRGKMTLADLFGGHSQLCVYHFMLGPDWAEGCKSCSYLGDHLDAALVHLRARDLSLVLVSTAPLATIGAFNKRMGWHIPWFSSGGTDFNHDFAITFTKEEVDSKRKAYNFGTQSPYSDENPGMSFFYKDPSGAVFHTYSLYARGLDVHDDVEPPDYGERALNLMDLTQVICHLLKLPSLCAYQHASRSHNVRHSVLDFLY